MDENSKLSLSQKMALFDSLCQPMPHKTPQLEGASERRQKGFRYRTQPVTMSEVPLVIITLTSMLLLAALEWIIEL